MGVLLGEPFLLASYPTPSQNFPQINGEPTPKHNRYLSVTYSPSHHGESFATVSVQGDGFHLLKLSNMHAILSHTLGPSGFFAAPAVTRLDAMDASTSYAVMQSVPEGIPPMYRGRTVCRWRDHHSRRPEETPEPKHTAVFPKHVGQIWVPSGLPSYVIAISPSGEVMLSDDALNVTASNSVADPGSFLLRSWVFVPEECTFLRHQGNQLSGMVVMCFIVVDSRLKLRITRAQSTGELKEITECDLGVHENITDISCDPSGYTTVLTQQSEIQFFRLVHDPTSVVTATSLDGPLRLIGMSSAPSTPDMDGLACGLSVISVGSSYILLAGISDGPTPDIYIVLWDIQYSVVLASQVLALPPTMAFGPKSLPVLELTPASRSQALLMMSPASHSHDTSIANAVPARSAVFVIPLEIPRVSTIALALGKAHETKKWLKRIHTPSNGSAEDDDHHRMLHFVQQALEQRHPGAAETAFFLWAEAEPAQFQDTDAPPQCSDRNYVNSQTSPKTGLKTSYGKERSKVPSNQRLSHQYVSNILSVILQPFRPPVDPPYPSKIVRYLIGRKVVGNAMVKGGLLQALRHRGDWVSITSALHVVRDLPEVDIIQLLADVVSSHRQHHNLHPNGIQLDSPSEIPSLPCFLATVVGYNMSPSMLLLALKLYLSDANDVVCILVVLDRWIRWRNENDTGLARFDDLPTGGAHASTIRQKKSKSLRNKEVPSWKLIMSFLQCVLDVNFLTLLQFPSSHSILERISQHLRQQLMSIEDLDHLRGPLESFARVQSLRGHGQRVGNEGHEERRRRPKVASESAELTLGLYHIEELVI